MMKTLPYIVTGVKDDATNYQIARLLEQITQERAVNATIAMLSYSNLKSDALNDSIIHLKINDETLKNDIDSDLLRMALNLHMTWSLTKTQNYHEIMKEFKDPYYRLSSISSVLSIPYKLRSIGLNMEDEENLNKLLEKMDESDSDNKKIYKLIQCEHRRWVIEKAIDGWKPPKNKEGYYSDEIYQQFAKKLDVKDKKNKIHACMVRSEKDMPLRHFIKKDWMKKQNDHVLDPLDELSVKFEQAICQRIKANPFDVESNDYVRQIKNLLSSEKEKEAFDQCHSVKQYLSQFTQFNLSELTFLFLRKCLKKNHIMLAYFTCL